MATFADRQKAYLQAATGSSGESSKGRPPERPPQPARFRAKATIETEQKKEPSGKSTGRSLRSTLRQVTSNNKGEQLENRQAVASSANGAISSDKEPLESLPSCDQLKTNCKFGDTGRVESPTVPISKSEKGGIIKFSKEGRDEKEMASSCEDEPVVISWNEEDKTQFQKISSPWLEKQSSKKTTSARPVSAPAAQLNSSTLVATAEVATVTISTSTGTEEQVSRKKGPKKGTSTQADPLQNRAQEAIEVARNLPATIEQKSSSSRFRVAQELYVTEHTYLRDLNVLVEVFKKALYNILSAKEVDTIFTNVENILSFNCELLALLYKHLSEWNDEETTIGDVFIELASRFNIYAVYCANHDEANNALSAAIKKKSDLQETLAAAYQDPRVKAGLDLHAYLLTPVQRMPRYLLLLNDIKKNTPAGHADLALLEEALSKLNHITDHINQQVREVQNQRALVDLRNQVLGLDVHELPGRKLTREGQVYLMSIRKLYQCILFNDLIVFALRGDGRASRVELALNLSTVWVHDLGNNDPQTTFQDALEIYTPDRPFTIYVKSVNEKRLWLNEIRRIVLAHLKEKSADREPPEDLEERTGLILEKSPSAVVSANDVVRRHAAFTYSDGRLYEGMWLDAMRHGHGEMVWKDKTRFVGEWVENERLGKGELTYSTAEVYDGDWVNDVQSGRGSLTLCNGDKYTGEWSDCLPHGDGQLEFANGDVYTGQLEQSTISGIGALKCKNGIRYEGQWVDSQFDGEGTHVTRYGDQYAGELAHNCRHGQGTMVYKNGDKYEGTWEKNHRQGHGILYEVSGAKYNGQWLADLRNGRGNQVYSRGDVYDGEWENNVRHGQGKLVFSTGDVYQGSFKHDHIYGTGIMMYADSGVFTGDFRYGQRHGFGTMEYANGGQYEGNWVHDMHEGEGTYAFEDEMYTGQFQHDRPHGHGVYSSGEGTHILRYEGEFVAGQRCGKGTETSSRGKYVGNWKYGMRHGPGVETSLVGTSFEGTWHCNQRHGRFTKRSINGQQSEIDYQYGCLVQPANAHDVPNMPILARTLL